MPPATIHTTTVNTSTAHIQTRSPLYTLSMRSEAFEKRPISFCHITILCMKGGKKVYMRGKVTMQLTQHNPQLLARRQEKKNAKNDTGTGQNKSFSSQRYPKTPIHAYGPPVTITVRPPLDDCPADAAQMAVRDLSLKEMLKVGLRISRMSSCAWVTWPIIGLLHRSRRIIVV